jgi:hypothetical protein
VSTDDRISQLAAAALQAAQDAVRQLQENPRDLGNVERAVRIADLARDLIEVARIAQELSERKPIPPARP